MNSSTLNFRDSVSELEFEEIRDGVSDFSDKSGSV